MKVTIKIKIPAVSAVNATPAIEAVVCYPPTQTKSVFDWLPDWATQELDSCATISTRGGGVAK